MKKSFYLFLLLSLISMAKVNARCIKDIVAAGLSFDSVSYSAQLENGELATLSSSAALGVRASWVIFCPKSKLELQPFIRFRQYSFADIASQPLWWGVSEKTNLLSIGIEGRRFKRLWGKNFEITAEVELREELGFDRDFTSTSPTINAEHYINLKAMSGLRYFAWHKGKRDITAVLKLGLLKGFDSKSDLGIIYGFSGEYYQKLGKRTSGKIDLYFDHYSQGFGSMSMSRFELGIRSNIVFRF